MPDKADIPGGLQGAGQALWWGILEDLPEQWELDARELDALTRACRCADELALLEAAVDRDGVVTRGSRNQTIIHPALSEARQLRLVQLRLLGAIALPDAEEQPQTAASQRASRAAQARWRRPVHLDAVLTHLEEARNE